MKTHNFTFASGGGIRINAIEKQQRVANIYVDGDIGESWWDDQSIVSREFVRELDRLDVETLNLYVNSHGGVVADGLAIYNALKRHPATVNAHIEGVAYSIASLIPMAGDTVYAASSSMLMIHSPWTGMIGNARDFRKTADDLDKIAEAISEPYVRNGISHEKVLEMLKDGENHYFTAAEAADFGFVDRLYNGLSVAAHENFDLSRYARNEKHRGMNMPKEKLEAKDQKTAGADSGAHDVQVSHGTDLQPGQPARSDKPAVQNVVDIETAAERRERQRILDRNSELGRIFSPHMAYPGVRDLYAECLGNPDLALDDSRDLLLSKLGENSVPISGNDAIIQPGLDEKDLFISAASDSLLMRAGKIPHDRANPYRGKGLLQIASLCLTRAGLNVGGMIPQEIAPIALQIGIVRGAQSTSDFPVILEDTINKLVLQGYQAQPTTWRRFCGIGTVNDFRAHKRIVPGLLGNFDEVNERGEFENKIIPDGEKNEIAAKRRGNIIDISPEALVNDDLDYIQRMATSFGMAAQRMIERLVYALIEANPVMSDGIELYHANHGNLAASGTYPTHQGLADAAEAMSEQKAPGPDQEFLDIAPAVGVAKTHVAADIRVLVEAQYDTDFTGKFQRPNKTGGMLADVVGTARLQPQPWYLFADPNVTPAIEVAFLQGQTEPSVIMQDNFRSGGIQWRVELPVAVGAIDYRPTFKNPGNTRPPPT